MTNESIGQKLSRFRKNARLTQKELGALIGKTESSIQKYEKGSTEIPLSVLLHISDALNIEIYEFLESEFVKYSNASDNAIDRLISALGYKVTSDCQIIKNGYAYHFTDGELLTLVDDIKLSTEDILNDALKKRRSNRTRVEDNIFTYD